MYRKLVGRIVEMYGRQYAFAEAIGMNGQRLSKILHGKAHWSDDEVRTVCGALGISRGEIGDFFYPEVPNA